jgi:DNA polymerase III sliding clamp (beta) subunit (PCNA family)
LKNVEKNQKKEGEEEEELITYRISGEQELTEYERKNLIGFEINYDLLVGILEQMKFGERLRELELEISPYTLTPKNLENTSIILGIGKTGSGKTVMGINLIRMFVNNNYTVVDISLNVKRAQEMIYVIMPMNEKYYKKGVS